MTASGPLGLHADDQLLRRVLHRPDHLEWHDDFNRWVPSLAAVRFDPDGMSVFVRRLLATRGNGPADVSTLGGMSTKPAVVYELAVDDVRRVGFAATSTPNEETPIGFAHASITKPDMDKPQERTARTGIATAMTLCHGHVTLPKPPGA